MSPGRPAGPVGAPDGSTYVHAVGAGPPVLVVHGGPGFDHGYLAAALLPLARRRKLIFYDQPGCGRTARSGELTLATSARHLAGMANAYAQDGRIGVIAHSWGALLLLAAVPSLPILSEGVLINPVAPSRTGFDEASQKLRERAPPAELARFVDLLMRGEGTAAMAVALPYYLGRPPVEPIVLPLNAATYLEVTGGLGDFDFSPALPAVAALTALVGSKDFTDPDLANAYLRACAHSRVMEGIGHFPFFEAPEAFAAALEEAFA